MKNKYLILGISFLLLGLVNIPEQVHAAGQTSIDFVVPEENDQETIKEIDKELLKTSDSSSRDSGGRQQGMATGNQSNAQQGKLPSTNDQKLYGFSLAGLSICLIVAIWKYKNYSKLAK